jgi:tetratricopeptide (TPR) repeat protein
MGKRSLKTLWRETLADPSESGFDRVARSVIELFVSDERFREHIQNRSKRVKEKTGIDLQPENCSMDSARAYVADEIGFNSWNELLKAIAQPGEKPILFQYAIAAMDRGDFTAVEEAIGTEKFHDQVVEWYERGFFENEQLTLDEIFAASCMLGYPQTAAFLLDKGVDPYAGMKTGLAGFHYAASSGRIDVIKLLIERCLPMEVKNMYGGTVFDQAIWSAVNEHTPQHAAIVEALVEAGAEVDEGYLEWWGTQDVPDPETKERIANVLAKHTEFQERLSNAKQAIKDAETENDNRLIADSLKALGGILRRPPFLREQANQVYKRAANIYKELNLPLEEAWVKRHIGINHEYAERLEEAEKYYDEALALYRAHSIDDLNYANAVRYPAVIKNRLGKREESRELWEEACRRYETIHDDGLGEGVAEASAWLTIFAIENDDLELAEKWFEKASEASLRSSDPATHKFVGEVRERLEMCKNS